VPSDFTVVNPVCYICCNLTILHDKNERHIGSSKIEHILKPASLESAYGALISSISRDSGHIDHWSGTTIQQHFGYSQSALQWIFSAYVIVFGALLLLGGRLSDIAGQRKMFVIGFAILTGASILAGLAPTGDVLISARALQGIGAAFIAPAAMSMVLNLFTVPKERSKAMGIWGAAAPAGGTMCQSELQCLH
jgi:MFS family permease